MFRADFIKRLIEQLGAFLAKVAELIGAGKLAEAEVELRAAEQAVGLPHGSDRLDARSLALLLGGKDKVVLLCLLLEQRAQLSDARNEPEASRRLRARAGELLVQARPEELVQQARDLGEKLHALRGSSS